MGGHYLSYGRARASPGAPLARVPEAFGDGMGFALRWFAVTRGIEGAYDGAEVESIARTQADFLGAGENSISCPRFSPGRSAFLKLFGI